MRNKKISIAILIIIILLFLTYIFFFHKDKSNNTNTSDTNTETDEYELKAEELLERMGGEYTVLESLSENFNINIVSPEGDTFIPGQARMWDAQVENLDNEGSAKANCHWKFYLNQYDEEELYEQFDKSSNFSNNNTEICGFTSTFIEDRGKLRVVLTIDVTNTYGDSLGSYTTERKYTVE